MCWQCISEEALFACARLTIVQRTQSNELFPPILLADVDGKRWWTNPAADWEFCCDVRGRDEDGVPFLLEVWPSPRRRRPQQVSEFVSKEPHANE